MSRNNKRTFRDIANNAPNQGAQGMFYGPVFVGPQDPTYEDPARIQRTSIYRVPLLKTFLLLPLSVFSMVVSLLNLVRSWIGLEDYFQHPFTYYKWMIIFVISLMVFVFIAVLRRIRFIRYAGLNIECGRNGSMYITRISGLCPRCNSKLMLRKVGPKEHKEIVVLCARNPSQHCWGFDLTVLGDVDEDI